MVTKKIQAIIEQATDGGYGIYCPDLDGISLFGYGSTEEEAKRDLEEHLAEYVEVYRESNPSLVSLLNNGKVEFDYNYDFSGFFKAYPVFNITELAKYLGINSSLLRQYKKGLAFASGEQKKRIEKGIHHLARQLGTVKF